MFLNIDDYFSILLAIIENDLKSITDSDSIRSLLSKSQNKSRVSELSWGATRTQIWCEPMFNWVRLVSRITWKSPLNNLPNTIANKNVSDKFSSWIDQWNLTMRSVFWKIYIKERQSSALQGTVRTTRIIDDPRTASFNAVNWCTTWKSIDST